MEQVYENELARYRRRENVQRIVVGGKTVRGIEIATGEQVDEFIAASNFERLSHAWMLRQPLRVNIVFEEFKKNVGAPVLLYSLTRLLEWPGYNKNIPGRFPFNQLSVPMLMTGIQLSTSALTMDATTIDLDLTSHTENGKPAIQLVYDLVMYLRDTPRDDTNKFVYQPSYGIVGCDIDDVEQRVEQLWALLKPLRESVQITMAQQQNRFLCCCDMNAFRASGRMPRDISRLTDYNMIVMIALSKN